LLRSFPRFGKEKRPSNMDLPPDGRSDMQHMLQVWERSDCVTV